MKRLHTAYRGDAETEPELNSAVVQKGGNEKVVVKDVFLNRGAVSVPDGLVQLCEQAYVKQKLRRVCAVCMATEVFRPEELMICSALMQDFAEEIFALGYELAEQGLGEGDELVGFSAFVRSQAQQVWMLAQTALQSSKGEKTARILERIKGLGSRYADPLRLFCDFIES